VPKFQPGRNLGFAGIAFAGQRHGGAQVFDSSVFHSFDRSYRMEPLRSQCLDNTSSSLRRFIPRLGAPLRQPPSRSHACRHVCSPFAWEFVAEESSRRYQLLVVAVPTAAEGCCLTSQSDEYELPSRKQHFPHFGIASSCHLHHLALLESRGYPSCVLPTCGIVCLLDQRGVLLFE
jgi:hypothetical protein